MHGACKLRVLLRLRVWACVGHQATVLGCPGLCWGLAEGAGHKGTRVRACLPYEQGAERSLAPAGIGGARQWQVERGASKQAQAHAFFALAADVSCRCKLQMHGGPGVGFPGLLKICCCSLMWRKKSKFLTILAPAPAPPGVCNSCQGAQAWACHTNHPSTQPLPLFWRLCSFSTGCCSNEAGAGVPPCAQPRWGSSTCFKLAAVLGPCVMAVHQPAARTQAPTCSSPSPAASSCCLNRNSMAASMSPCVCTQVRLFPFSKGWRHICLAAPLPLAGASAALIRPIPDHSARPLRARQAQPRSHGLPSHPCLPPMRHLRPCMTAATPFTATDWSPCADIWAPSHPCLPLAPAPASTHVRAPPAHLECLQRPHQLLPRHAWEVCGQLAACGLALDAEGDAGPAAGLGGSRGGGRQLHVQRGGGSGWGEGREGGVSKALRQAGDHHMPCCPVEVGQAGVALGPARARVSRPAHPAS